MTAPLVWAANVLAASVWAAAPDELLVNKLADPYTSEHWIRANIDIDDDLLNQAMTATGQTTKKATVEEAVRMVVQLHRQRQAGAELAGIGWEGDLDAMRDGRVA